MSRLLHPDDCNDPYQPPRVRFDNIRLLHTDDKSGYEIAVPKEHLGIVEWQTPASLIWNRELAIDNAYGRVQPRDLLAFDSLTHKHYILHCGIWHIVELSTNHKNIHRGNGVAGIMYRVDEEDLPSYSEASAPSKGV